MRTGRCQTRKQKNKANIKKRHWKILVMETSNVERVDWINLKRTNDLEGRILKINNF